jgi:tRNA pseudouridine38-40 synthase
VKNFRLTLAYDGTPFLGWQKTAMGPSIEETLEGVLVQILQHPVQLQAASRTDAGVHARGQVVNFFSPTALSCARLLQSINGLLPNTIVLRDITEAPFPFHPTLDALEKEYHYTLCLSPLQLPFDRTFSWHVPFPLNLDAMAAASLLLTGTHDFAAFSNERTEDTIRTLSKVTPHLTDTSLTLTVRGNRFLYRMVRNLVGTLVAIGRGQIIPTDLPAIFQSRDRRRAGMTAPPHGLSLEEVAYA